VNSSELAMHKARRIALINPTKFLGNLLLAGGIIQQLSHWCAEHDKKLLIVLDESFSGLFSHAFPGTQVIFYPRKALLPGSPTLTAMRAWLACIRQIRAFAADVAFNIEEDSVCHRLTHFSGAGWKVSSTTHRYHRGFNQVLDVARSQRQSAEQSIWYSFREVLTVLGVPVRGDPSYVQLNLSPPDASLLARFKHLGLNDHRPLLLLHAGASKAYKQWPVAHFAHVAGMAIDAGYQVVLIGAGQIDQQANLLIRNEIRSRFQLQSTEALAACIDLCNQLSLCELAGLISISQKLLGNDSGPSHLASALGVPGVVIFGPTDLAIWRPLGAQTTVLDSKSSCEPTCTRHVCRLNYRCLSDITPQLVIERLELAATNTQGKHL
jgi:ADP-heptose:LPS heptosyltransferase